ncbi:MAG: F0F1 ATP synthase subunit delta [Burkholderiales bacterium]|jgi:F-type H+-transporting ATPase subunit delta|nr:F0F1 ATP synthase subunit delta [Burkholderiales bacterium]
MAESLTIARPYAEAVFRLARDAGALPSWSDALGRLAAIAGNESARELLGNPRLTTDQVSQLLADAAGQLAPEQMNLVRVLSENERLAVLPEIAQHFETLRSGFENVVDAHVVSAFPLSDAQVAQVVDTLQAKYGRTVKVSVSIDADLIGGVSVQVGDEVMDASVRGKLAQLAGVLKA